jgi:transcriptional regulator with XRE-family HTH domain
MGRDAVGVRLRYARKKLRDLTQPELAKLSGVSQATISETETGETKSPAGPHLAALAHALQVNSQWLAHGKGPMEIPKPTTTQQQEFSAEALKVAANWSQLAPEVGKKIADMLEEMVKASTADPEPGGKRSRKTT